MKTYEDLRKGYMVAVSQKIKEGDKERIISFEGRIIKSRGVGPNKMLTVRQEIDKIDVDRIFPLNSPSIVKIERIEEKKKKKRKSKKKK